MASSTRNQGSVRAPFVNINQLTRSGASNGDVPVFNSPKWGVGEGGGGGGGSTLWADLFGSTATVDGSDMTLVGFNYGNMNEAVTSEAAEGDVVLRMDPNDDDKRLRLWLAHDGEAWEPLSDPLEGGVIVTLTGKRFMAGGGWMGQGQFVSLEPGNGVYPLPGLQWVNWSIGSDPTVVGYIAESRLDDETGFNAYDGEGVQSIVLWADLESGVTVFVRDSGRVCTADGEGAYTTVTASQGQYHTEDGVVAYMPEVGFPSILSPTSSGGAGGGGGARYIEPFMAFEFGPITDAIWETAPLGVLFWCQAGGGGEGRMTRGFYRTDGTSTVVRDESYDVDAPFTVIHVLQGLYEDVSDFVDRQAYRGTSLLWVFSDWNATKEMPTYHVGTTAELVTVDYEPENYTLSGGDGSNSVGDHLAGIDNAIGEQFLDSVYVPTSGPLVDLATGMEFEVETPEVLTLTGNTVHVRSVDQDHTGKTILVECTLVDQHDRSGRRLKGFEMVGTASDAYSFALTLNGSLTPLDGSAWENGHREDTGIYIGFSGKAVAELNDSDGYPFSRSAQFTSPIPSNDLDDHRISIIVSTGPNPTFNGVIETEFEIVPVWEDANEGYTPDDPAKWESLDPGDPEVPETKREGLDLLVHTVVDLLDTVADLAAPGVKVITEIELDAWDYEVKPGDRHVYFDPSIDHAYTVGVSGLLGGVAFQETWLYNDSAVFNLEVETAFLVSPGQAMHIIWNGTTYTAHVLDAPTAL